MFRRERAYTARLLCSAAVSTLVLLSGAAHAQEQPAIQIAAQPLSKALGEFAAQTKQAVLVTPALTQNKVSAPVAGAATPEAALTAMLAGTGLTYRRDGDTFLVVQGGSAPQDQSAAGGGAEVEALIVTAQKKEEAIQDVPIAISAFTQKSLDAQKIEGGFDLLKAIPNVTFSKTNFTGYNFSIRGIGTKAVSASTDPGVAVAFNNAGLIHNRLFEQEYFDIERVEVLRGPQGTLYGRNATGGVINLISAKPRMGEFEGDLKVELGNYNAKRFRAMINVPVGDAIAVRLAGAWTKRDGYGVNLSDGSDVDDRNLWSSRLSVGLEPNDRFRANFIWEHFEENDGRVRTSKQLCHHDPSPGGGQGCLPGSLYAPEAFGTPNGQRLPFVQGIRTSSIRYGFHPGGIAGSCNTQGYLYIIDSCQPDPYGGRMQSTDLRAIESLIPPVYRAKADIYQFNLDFDLTESLTFTSQTVYNRDSVYSTQDFNRFKTLPIFNDSQGGCQFLVTATQPCIPTTESAMGNALTPNYLPLWPILWNLAPGGFYDDPQFGPADTIVGMDRSEANSTQFGQEFRLQSNFDGPLNFSLGANYTYFNTVNDYYAFFNLISLIAEGWINFDFNRCNGFVRSDGCVYIDPNPIDQINGDGHNYFRSQNPYRLNSTAVFGELYWQATDTVNVTLGARWTADKKIFTPHPSQTLLIDACQATDKGPNCDLATTVGGAGFPGGLYGSAGRGYPAEPDIVQEWREPTGRAVIDWKPDLAFTDDTMIYASVSHGYKGGGANPPSIAAPLGTAIDSFVDAPRVFEPEFVDALEIGTKNTLLGGALIFNATAFYYDYRDYQVSKIVNRSAHNENFDAEVWGLELEYIWSPTRNFRINGTFGHLGTRIADGEQSIDLMDRTQGGGQFFITPIANTAFDATLTPRSEAEYVAGISAPADQPFLAFDEWAIGTPAVWFPSNCVYPVALRNHPGALGGSFCPGGDTVFGSSFQWRTHPELGFFSPTVGWNPRTMAPNMGSGFFADLGGNELPNAPHWTASLGAQYTMELPGGWDATLRGDFYWQSQSYARVYNTQYDKLRAWTNTNVSLWVENADWGVTAEVYVKNAFDETPITDAFLLSDDTALVTNVFTLDPRLIGVSIRKSF